jgi:multidrug resistance efflux pump
MEADFGRTLAALRADRNWASLVIGGVTVALLAVWMTWFFGASVTVYATSSRARVEVSPSPAHIAVPVAGRIARVNLVVGAHVSAGEILVELEATSEQISLSRARSIVASLQAEVTSIARELSSEDAGAAHGGSSDREGLREVLARQRAADAALQHAAEEEARMRSLLTAGAASEADLSAAIAEHREKRAASQALVHQGDALNAGNRQRDSARKVRREQLDRQHGQLQGELAAAQAEVARLENEVERRSIRAPLAGTLGEVAALQPGAVLAEGTVIGTVVPPGELHVVAEYAAESVGRIEADQRGRLRLDGFPWTQYGSLPLEVARVASDLRDGTVRVELVLRGSHLPVHHGMTGTVDVEVEQTTPVALLLRAAGDRTRASRK